MPLVDVELHHLGGVPIAGVGDLTETVTLSPPAAPTGGRRSGRRRRTARSSGRSRTGTGVLWPRPVASPLVLRLVGPGVGADHRTWPTVRGQLTAACRRARRRRTAGWRRQRPLRPGVPDVEDGRHVLGGPAQVERPPVHHQQHDGVPVSTTAWSSSSWRPGSSSDEREAASPIIFCPLTTTTASRRAGELDRPPQLGLLVEAHRVLRAVAGEHVEHRREHPLGRRGCRARNAPRRRRRAGYAGLPARSTVSSRSKSKTQGPSVSRWESASGPTTARDARAAASSGSRSPSLRAAPPSAPPPAPPRGAPGRPARCAPGPRRRTG